MDTKVISLSDLQIDRRECSAGVRLGQLSSSSCPITGSSPSSRWNRMTI